MSCTNQDRLRRRRKRFGAQEAVMLSVAGWVKARAEGAELPKPTVIGT